MKNQILPDEIARISFLANKCLACVQQNSATEALLAARKATEGMLYSVAQQKKFITDMKIRSLEDYLKIFHGKQDCLPQPVYLHVQTIQKFSNPMLHFQAIDYEYDSITLQNCLNALASIILWYVGQFPEDTARCLFDVSQSLLNSVPLVKRCNDEPIVADEYENKSHVEISRLVYRANQKDINAMLYLAKLYKQGYAGIPRGLDKAFEIFSDCVVSTKDDGLKSIALDEMSKIHYSQHNYPESFQRAQKSAELGNPRIMIHLAFLYNRGIGTDPNKAAAEKWYRTAAESKNPVASIACHDLAMFYKLSVSNQAIRQQLLKSAALNHTKSCYEIGEAYFLGDYGFPQDRCQANGLYPG